MYMKNKTLLAISVISTVLVYGCASLPPKDQRTVQYTNETNANKSTAYNRALGHLAKNFKDANHAIKIQNKDDAEIIAKGNISCNIFRNFGDINEYNLQFDLDFQAKDKKVRLVFEDLMITGTDGRMPAFASSQITNAEKLEKAKECLEPIRNDLLKAIKGNSDNW